MKILAIDDSLDNLTALQAVVSDRLPEATVLTARNGPDGLGLAHAEDPDLILLDIVMPGMDGYEVCRRLKADPLLEAIPVLFLSTNRADRASRFKALEAGAEGFLAKPFDDLELTAQIRSMVKIKAATSRQRAENERLASLVEEHTRDLARELGEHRRAEVALQASKRELQEAQRLAGVGSWSYDPATQQPEWSEGMFRIWGLDPKLGAPSYSDHRKLIHPEDYQRFDDAVQQAVQHGTPYELELRICRPDGRTATVITLCEAQRNAAGNVVGLRGTNQDITEQKQAERLRQLSVEVLSILNEPLPFADTIQRTLAAIKRELGVEAAGVRLRDGDDFPYLSQDGFPAEFIEAESALAERDERGDVCRDRNGDICLSCTCGLVISGKTDAGSPLFTPGGSFWTNDSSLLLDLSAEEDPRQQPRNRCIHDGYASVALIPIQTNQEIVGLLHLNDRRRGHFTLRQIQSLEGICTGISGALMRRRAEEELRRSRATLQRTMQHVSFGVVVVGRDKRIRQVNPAAVAMAGYGSAAELVGTVCHSTICPSCVGACPVLDLGQEIDRSERLLVRRDGSMVPILKSVVPVELGGEDVLLESFVDITEWKQAEDKILQQQSALEKAQELGQIGSWELDLRQNRLYWSDENCRIFAVPPGSAVDYELFLGKVHPDDRDYVDREWRAALDGKPYEIEHRLDLDRVVRWVREKADVEFDEKGEAVRALGFTQDITERKLLEDRVRQSERMDAIGQLAGGVAHDFNNMLEVILGHTEMALDDVDPGQPLHEDLQEVLKAARRSADLTRQLLAFARKQAISPRVLDLNETVEATLKMLRRLIGENITLDWQPKDGLWPVMMDPSQVDQILANLCVNARDAIGGVGAIAIRSDEVVLDEDCASDHICPVPGDYVVLSVSDNGCGMDEETAARVFEPFFTTKELGKGTGLGLATVYGVVRQNGGGIEICSEPGLGTSFEIYLPRHVGAVAAMVGEQAAPALRGTETILMVEDEGAILKMAKKMLENQGYAVLATESPAEAIRLVAAHAGDIDLLMTDVIMPEMNGRDLASRLLAVQPELKCLFMSGYTADVISHHGVLEEGINFIHKPFSSCDLKTTIREILDGTQGEQ
jgi:PAS domain S-box-containing protein